MAKFTKAERQSINEAWRTIGEACACTNWSDVPAWREAEKVERRQFPGQDCPGLSARAMICKAWAEGLDNPDKPARELYWIRPGFRDALLLGVRHAVERRGDDYAGPIVEQARALCSAVIEAIEGLNRRIVEGE